MTSSECIGPPYGIARAGAGANVVISQDFSWAIFHLKGYRPPVPTVDLAYNPGCTFAAQAAADGGGDQSGRRIHIPVNNAALTVQTGMHRMIGMDNARFEQRPGAVPPGGAARPERLLRG